MHCEYFGGSFMQCIQLGISCAMILREKYFFSIEKLRYAKNL